MRAAASANLRAMAASGVAVKIVTGDNERVTRHVCTQLGVAIEGVLTGSEVALMHDDALRARVEGDVLSLSSPAVPQPAPLAEDFDATLAAAVEAYQETHGFDATGELEERHAKSLNVPVEHRVRQAEGVWGHYVVRAVPTFGADGEITELDMKHAADEAQRTIPAPLAQNRKVVHMVPLEHRIDGTRSAVLITRLATEFDKSFDQELLEHLRLRAAEMIGDRDQQRVRLWGDPES